MTDTIILKPDLESVREAREFVALVVGSWGIDDYLARQIVSELVTNAVNFSSKDQYIVVRAYRCAERHLLEVWDQCPKMPLQQQPGFYEQGGRGLLLVSALSRSWETRPIAEGGKVVSVVLATSLEELEEKNRAERPLGYSATHTRESAEGSSLHEKSGGDRTVQSVLLVVVQALFSGWKIEIDRGVWVAQGKCLIRATTVDLLVESLYKADPGVFRDVADLLLGDSTIMYE